VAVYSVLLMDSVRKDLDSIPPKDLHRIYSIQDFELTVWVVKVAHRREVYR